MDSLYKRLVPQVRELIEENSDQFPATTEELIEHLKVYAFWTDMPYYICKNLYEVVYGVRHDFDEELFRGLFEDEEI